ncbi:arginine--tRNA ligase [Cohnella endophytica]|uniref:Arginine--tRNA ligase n=1 Tax=Cohnella endophytica TaxID=2419778 RepID=A0A494XBV8_9BACL|nr:arginine--tRNA ligase [Cohnella endophytica]RKP48050.1 arginine--tRNA ligase [Cohnella endophytica]
MLMKSAAAAIAPHLPSITAEQLLGMLEVPPKREMGDVCLPCFTFAKTLRQSPQMIAERLAGQVNSGGGNGEEAFGGGIRASAIGGYLNLFFADAHWKSDIVEAALEEGYGLSAVGQDKRVVIDMSSPNIAKPLGIGHLRSTMIGNALVNLYRATGYKAENVNHLGDWGTQFGKLIVAYRRWGTREALESEPIKESLRLYVKFHEEIEREPGLEDEAREAFANLENGDDETRRLWQYFVDESMKEFHRVYARLGVKFDHYLGESFYNDKIDGVVSALREQALLEESDGAQVVRLEELGLPPCIILKKDGSTIYGVRDLATAIYRKQEMHADEILYVVGAEQSLHFRQVFAVLEKMGHSWAEECRHVPFGLMTVNGKKMSTRKGKVVFLEEVLDEAVERALQIILEKSPELKDKEKVAKAVGVGAVIFGDLKHHRQLSVDFNLEDAVSFDGETGPYLQYTHARIRSLLARGNYSVLGDSYSVNGSHLASESTWECAKTLSRYETVLQEAVKDNEPFVVARYLLDLAKDFNRFYNSGKILTADADKAVVFSQLSLAAAVANVLSHGLAMLGIEAPQEM